MELIIAIALVAAATVLAYLAGHHTGVKEGAESQAQFSVLMFKTMCLEHLKMSEEDATMLALKTRISVNKKG